MTSENESGFERGILLDEVLASVERSAIVDALRRADWCRSLAALLLNISRSRLYRRMKALGIDPKSLFPGHQGAVGGE